MTTSCSTLELIDHALADWATSPDAMRWAPDAKPDERPWRQEFEGVYLSGLTDEQWRDLQALYNVISVSMTSYAAHCQQVMERLAPIFAAMAQAQGTG